MNKENLKPNSARTPSERVALAKKAGQASGKARRERKTIAQALRMVLDETLPEDKTMTKLEAIAVKVIANVYKRGDVHDLKALAEILGEFKTNITAEGLNLTIKTSEEGKENIEAILNGE